MAPVNTYVWKVAIGMVTSQTLGLALVGVVAFLGCDGTNQGASSQKGGVGSSSTSKPQFTYRYRLPEGFARYTELGEQCGAAYATIPSVAVGELTFIPCTSGVRGCEQLEDRAWGKAIVNVDELSSQRGFLFQVAHDGRGNANKIMQTYGPSNQLSGAQGIVVHALPSGEPLAAWRNDPMAVEHVYDNNGVPAVVNPGILACTVRPILAHNTVWIVADPADSSGMKVAHGPISDPSATTHFAPFDVDSTVLDGTILASDEALAVEQSDGRITIFHATDNSQVSFYGPSMRVWLHSIVGTDVIVYNDKGTDGILYFRIGLDGTLVQLPRTESNLRINGDRLAWPVLQKQSSSQESLAVRNEPYSSIGNPPAQTADQSDPISPAKSVQLYPQFFLNGYYALLSSEASPTAYFVDVASGDVKSLTVPSETADVYSGGATLLAVTDSHVWLAYTMLMEPRYYHRLRRMVF